MKALLSKKYELSNKLDHPNIIKLYEVYEDEHNKGMFLIEEFGEGGELFDYILDNDGLFEQEAAHIFHQITSSIVYGHKNCISHRDLKPDNFMLVKKEK